MIGRSCFFLQIPKKVAGLVLYYIHSPRRFFTIIHPFWRMILEIFCSIFLITGIIDILCRNVKKVLIE
jgi:hypothetical protein